MLVHYRFEVCLIMFLAWSFTTLPFKAIFRTVTSTRTAWLHCRLNRVLWASLWHLWASSWQLRRASCSHTTGGWWHWVASRLWCTWGLWHHGHHWHLWHHLHLRHHLLSSTSSWKRCTASWHLWHTPGTHTTHRWSHRHTTRLWHTRVLGHWDQHGRFAPWWWWLASHW